MKKRKKNAEIAPGELIREKLGLNKSEWDIGVGYSKGFLSKSRGVDVSVTHVPTGRMKSGYFPSTSKAAARRDAINIVQRYIKELQRE